MRAKAAPIQSNNKSNNNKSPHDDNDAYDNNANIEHSDKNDGNENDNNNLASPVSQTARATWIVSWQSSVLCWKRRRNQFALDRRLIATPCEERERQEVRNLLSRCIVVYRGVLSQDVFREEI